VLAARHLDTDSLIHCPVVADQKVGVAAGSVGTGAMRFLWWRAIRSQARPEFDGHFSLPSSGSPPRVFSHISGILGQSLRRSSILLVNIYLLSPCCKERMTIKSGGEGGI
jgi:hypothetical protein